MSNTKIVSWDAARAQALEEMDFKGYKRVNKDLVKNLIKAGDQQAEEIENLKYLLKGIHEEVRDSGSGSISYDTMVDIEDALQEQRQ